MTDCFSNRGFRDITDQRWGKHPEHFVRLARRSASPCLGPQHRTHERSSSVLAHDANTAMSSVERDFMGTGHTKSLFFS